MFHAFRHLKEISYQLSPNRLSIGLNMKQDIKTDQCLTIELKKESKEVKSIRHKVSTKKEYKIYTRCKHCSLSLKGSYNLKRHIKQNICIRKKFKCKYCRKKFNTVTEEIMHVTKLNCLDCIICKTTSKSFIQHRLKHTNVKKYNCKSFHASVDLRRHTRVHTGELPYKCGKCDRTFSTSNNMVAHQKRHEDLKPHQCLFCDKSFFTRTDLNVHILVHTGQKPHSCNECGKTFASKSNLRSHFKIHADGKNFPCPECKKSFKTARYLKEHIERHNNDILYSCPQCNKRLKTIQSLKKHSNKHLKVVAKPFTIQCPECEEVYITTQLLKDHMRIIHNNILVIK